MKEDQAKKKICPQTLVRAGSYGTVGNCVGNNCMAWHWTEWDIDVDGSRGEPISGYCGLTSDRTRQ